MSVLTDAIIRVDIDSLDPQVLSELSKAAIETGNPLKAKKRDFQCFCGIHFGTVETSYAIALPSGKIIMDNQFSGDAHHKDKTNVLLRPNPPYEIIAFGKAATDKYIFTKNKKALYFERFKMSLYDKELSHTITDDEKQPGTVGMIKSCRTRPLYDKELSHTITDDEKQPGTVGMIKSCRT
eukprot:1002958_1